MKARLTSEQNQTDRTSSQSTGTQQLIQRRAYELYLDRGEVPGHELEDWLEAEREVKGGIEAGRQVKNGQRRTRTAA